MTMILYEQEVCTYLDIPSIPKREWDGSKSFKNGVAEVSLITGETGYAVATFDAENDDKPRVKKVFSLVPFTTIGKIHIVPSYMETDVESMDLDESSQKAAKRLIEEAAELENDDTPLGETPLTKEYFFDNINDDEEAAAFIRAYNQKKKIKGRIPKNHEAIVMRLAVIYEEENKQTK